MNVTAEVSATFHHINRTAQGVSIALELPTLEDAQAFVAKFPKSYGMHATTLVSNGMRKGYVTFRAALLKNGVNGGKNETGIGRYRKVMKALDTMGVRIGWVHPYSNSYMTRETFEATL